MDQKVQCNTLQNNKPRSKMAKEAPLHIIVVQTQHSPQLLRFAFHSNTSRSHISIYEDSTPESPGPGT